MPRSKPLPHPLALPLLLAAFAGACQCATLREDLLYRCDTAADCADGQCVDGWCQPEAPPGDAGSDGGAAEDGGGGTDAGAEVCNSWECVRTLWPNPDAVTNALGVRTFPVPKDIVLGTYAWFGGVLLPDGKVLAIPHTANRALLIDPSALSAAAFGPELFPAYENERMYAGGVLAPDGFVYAFPYARSRLLRIDPATGERVEVGPELVPETVTEGARMVGGAVDRFGHIWSASEGVHGILRFEPVSGESRLFASPDGGLWGGWWGMTRLADDRLVLFPKEGVHGKKLSPAIVIVTPTEDFEGLVMEELPGYDAATQGIGLQGGALTWSGAAWSASAGLDERAVFLRTDDVPEIVLTGADAGFGFLGTFSDGQVWTSPDNSATGLNLWRFNSDGKPSLLQSNVVVPRYAYLGLVATPAGLVGIPGTTDLVLLLQPGAAKPDGGYDSRPMPVLLSPYFNKL